MDRIAADTAVAGQEEVVDPARTDWPLVLSAVGEEALAVLPSPATELHSAVVTGLGRLVSEEVVVAW